MAHKAKNPRHRIDAREKWSGAHTFAPVTESASNPLESRHLGLAT
jgi:hypothetical protein